MVLLSNHSITICLPCQFVVLHQQTAFSCALINSLIAKLTCTEYRTCLPDCLTQFCTRASRPWTLFLRCHLVCLEVAQCPTCSKPPQTTSMPDTPQSGPPLKLVSYVLENCRIPFGLHLVLGSPLQPHIPHPWHLSIFQISLYYVQSGSLLSSF